MLVKDDADDDVLVTSERTRDADAIAFADDAVRLRVFGVNLHLAALTGTLGFRTCLEQTRHVQPDVESNGVVHSDQDFDLRLGPQRVHEQLRLRMAVLLREVLLDLPLGFLERYDARVLLIDHFDDVIAEL